MPEEPDWSLTTFEGNRRRQHQEFHALPFREKLARIEEMAEVAERLASQRRNAPGDAQPKATEEKPGV